MKERIVYVCRCGNRHCESEAIEERCRYFRDYPAPTLESASQVPTEVNPGARA